jgi:hypothetical protein
MPEEAERQNLSQENKNFIEVEAPERLKWGQNLYDQEPFSSIVESFCESTDLTPDNARIIISHFSESHYYQTAMHPSTQLQGNELLNKIYLNNSLPKNLRIAFDYQLKILEALQEYPYWSEYIALRQQAKLYRYNGSFAENIHGKTEPPAISYANWVTKKLQREKNLWLVGIEEIFPKDVGHPVTTQPNITGIKPGNRRYRILKAAGFIK